MNRKNLLRAKAIIKSMVEEEGGKMPDNIDLEFDQFLLLWETISTETNTDPVMALIWMDVPNPIFDGDTPKFLMKSGRIDKVVNTAFKKLGLN